eukprot:TRINITY_DN9508_c0_g6_i1.p1 TRINITY_DN9508_c0_g6~~TRINITY_DN9508_c0_g6_i1.p1  ORF type:complete len:666 (+),score=213.48 TRINITY_DN9508_c0_g6_i1:84-2081(+)
MKPVWISILTSLSIGSNAVAAEEKAVSKVVKVLQEMKKELEDESDSDDATYKKFKCWCDDNEEAKEQAIKDATDNIPQLEGKVDASLFETVRLKGEIKSQTSSLEKARESLKEATSQHEQKMKGAAASQKDMREYIDALAKAHKKLKSGPSFLSRRQDVKAAAELAEKLQSKLSKRFLGVIGPHKHQLMMASIRSIVSGSALEEPDPSSHIEGVISEMKETFSADLEASEKDEKDAKLNFSELRKAKNTEIEAIDESILQKRTQKANSEVSVAEHRQSIKDSKKTLEADTKFLKDLKDRCKTTASEYEDRTNMRNKEVAAVAEAIATLSSDAARDLFDKTLEKPAAFLQTSSKQDEKAIHQAAEILDHVATTVNDPKLLALVSAVRSTKAGLDSFGKVKEALSKLKTEIKDKKDAETSKKQDCTERSNKNSLESESFTRDHSDAESEEANLEASIEQLTKALEAETKEVETLKKELKEAEETRDKARKEFDASVADQQETQKTLGKAIVVLKAQYQKDAALIQGKPAEPEGFKELSPNKKGNTVIAMLTEIQRNAEALEKAARRGEEVAAENYADFKTDTAISIAAKEESILDTKAAKAKAEEDRLNSKDAVSAAAQTLESLSKTAAAIKEECSFLLTNFEVRQAAYDQEMDSLDQANALLSGAK